MRFLAHKLLHAILANTVDFNSNFFGNPNGPKPPAKQSKLSFSSKSTSNGAPTSNASKENDDVDMEDAAEQEVKPKVEDDAIAKKENVKPGTGRGQCGKSTATTNAALYRVKEAIKISSSFIGQEGHQGTD